MTEKETTAVLAVIKAAYPAFYKGMSRDDLLTIVRLWQRQFSADSADEVMAAVESLIATRTNNFPPVIGEVKASLQSLRTPNAMTESAAWALVAKACNTSDYKRSFDTLPKTVQAAVGSAEQLRSWALLPLEEFQTVVASNFQRSFRIYAQRERDDALLPESVRAIAGKIANGFALDRPTETRLLEGAE